MGNLLCLLTGILLPFLVLGLAVRRGLRPMAAASAYRNVAWKLGLEADTRGVSLQGYVDRRRLFVGEVVDHDGRRRRVQVRAVVDLDVPLGVGLWVRPRQQRRLRLRRRAPTTSLQLGEPALDEALEVRAFEADVARGLFDDEVRGALADLVEHYRDVEITDHWVRVHLSRHPSSDRALLALVDALKRMAVALERARQTLDPPEAMARLVPAWQGLAERLQLQLLPALPCVTGTVDGRAIRITPVRREDDWCADVRLVFADHTALGLQLAPQRAEMDRWSIGQDIEVDDPAFDDAFIIKGFDPRTIRAALGPDVRAALLALQGRASVRVDDVVLQLEDAPVDADVLASLVGDALQAAHALGW